MTRTAQIDYLFKLERKGIKLGLGPTRQLLEKCGNPHHKVKAVQIAGTNGKGSTAAITWWILKRHGVIAGLYTSPHLLRFNERIRVGDHCIPDDYMVYWIKTYRATLEELDVTFFEATTVMALSYFAECGVDLAVLETGLGGRLDATTAAGAKWAALTPIDLDHMDMLGETTKAIAQEKAAIIRSGGTCYSAPQSPVVTAVIRDMAAERQAQVEFIPATADIPHLQWLPGEHQRLNAALARRLAQVILGHEYDEGTAREAIRQAVWPGRYQIIRSKPRIIFDVAHNPHGFEAFWSTFEKETVTGLKWLVLALQTGKSACEALQVACQGFDRIILTQTGIRHYMAADDLTTYLQHDRPEPEVIPDPVAAINTAAGKAKENDLIVILGSHYLGPAVAEALKISFDMVA